MYFRGMIKTKKKNRKPYSERYRESQEENTYWSKERVNLDEVAYILCSTG